jgi:predicted HicB family RNase H-like nuclease
MNDCLEYKGYIGMVNYSAEDDLLCGKVYGINDLILYHGESLEALKKDFQESIDDYLETCKAEGIEPNKPYSPLTNIQIPSPLHKMLYSFSESRNQTPGKIIEEALINYIPA